MSIQSPGVARKKINQNDYFPAVAANYSAYADFLARSKVTETESILLNENSQRTADVGQTTLMFPDTAPAGLFVAEVAKTAALKFSLKIRERAHGEQPCFRFCSRGNDHFNVEAGGGLSTRPVPCPHFHRVDQDGWMRAYHTPLLADPQANQQVAGDVAAGVNHFCAEAMISTPAAEFVTVVPPGDTLPLRPTGALDLADLP